MHTETKQEKDKGARAWHMLMTSQRTKEGGTGIYKRGFPGIVKEVRLGITPVFNRYNFLPPTLVSCNFSNTLQIDKTIKL